jgi:hypothetical protein
MREQALATIGQPPSPSSCGEATLRIHIDTKRQMAVIPGYAYRAGSFATGLIYSVSSDVFAIAYGLMSAIGIALSATGIVLGKSKK